MKVEPRWGRRSPPDSASRAWLLGPALAAALVCGAPRAEAAPPDPDPWFGPDKALHFGVCAGIAGAGYGFTSLATPDIRIRVAFGAGLAITAGAVKEFVDLAGYGDPSWRDFAWDVFGTLVGVGISVAIDFAVRGSSVAATAH